MKNFYIALSASLSFLFCSSLACASKVENVSILPEDTWVTPKNYDIPDTIPSDNIENGVYYLLKDDQVYASEGQSSKYYHHFAELIVNPRGLEYSSQINIKFDPEYQELTLHKLQISRNGIKIDKLDSAKISILQREKELEDLIYSGKLTANIILDDVRVGDVIEYSYSIDGDNPIYDGIFSDGIYIEWAVPLHHQYFRLIWKKSTPLYINRLNTDIKIIKSKLGGDTEYVIETRDSTPHILNSERPGWHIPFGFIVFSELQAWSDVVSWAVPLYKNALIDQVGVEGIANELRIKHADIEEQIVGALQYVQAKIRYLGIETGTNSHRPSVATETLRRRYGDCKDKTVLLISILNALGVEAYPALVNTKITKMLKQFPPYMDAFNHVIVLVKHAGQQYWFDPTRQYQPGKINEIYQPGYGYALVVDSSSVGLTNIDEGAVKSGLSINEKFDLSSSPGGKVAFESHSEYFGYSADIKRNQISVNGLAGLAKRFVEFYKYYYPGLESTSKMELGSEENVGTLTLSEKYSINEFWTREDEEGKYSATFYASSIATEIQRPEQVNRNSPYLIKYPNNITQNIEIQLDSSDWWFDDEKIVEDNEFFNLEYTVEFSEKNKSLVLSYQFSSKVDHVNPEQLDNYIDARDRALNLTSYGIVKNTTSSTVENDAEGVFDLKTAIFIFILCTYTLSIIYAIVSWRLEMRRKEGLDEQIFFPVSLLKLSVFSVATLGIYSTYWFYRNWKSIKHNEGTSIMPIARAFFSYFWYYPLYSKLADDSVERFRTNLLPGRLLAAMLAIGYFILLLISSVDYVGVPAIVLAPLLLVPLANYINHISRDNNAAYLINSKWRLRHYLLSVLFIPFIVFTYGGELNLLSSSKAVGGRMLWRHDLKFMERNEMISPGERVVMFYSDAFLDIREDGNGFTDNTVFSYWNDRGFLHTRVAKLIDVQDIKHSYAESWSDNTALTIVLNDGSEFILYVSSEDRKDRLFVKLLRGRWAHARAESGNSELQYKLSLVQRETSSLAGKAKILNDWLVKAADSGDPKAQFQLGLSLLSGIDGRVEKQNSLDLLMSAADNGHPNAEFLLGELYSKGIHFTRDAEKAIYWYEKAYQHNQRNADNYLAWHLSTLVESDLRDGERAIVLMEKSIEKRKTSATLSVLAAAYAEVGLFDLSVSTQEEAIQRYGDDVEQHELDCLESYKSGSPWRQTWSEEKLSRIDHIPIFKAVPTYPYFALQNSIGGWATTEYDIKPDGSVENIKLVDASVDSVFHAVSISATKTFVYFPRMIDGEAVAVKGVRNRFTFSMAKE